MKKPLKIVLIVFAALTAAATITLFCLYLFGDKGEKRDDVVIQPDANKIIGYDETLNIDDCSPAESLFILAGRIKNLQSYQAAISGEVKTGIVNQEVSGAKYVTGGKSLYISRSVSKIKQLAKQIYIQGDTVLVRNGNAKTDVYENEVARYTLSEYLNEYGNEYGNDYRELSNYTLNENTVKNATFVSVKDGLYTFEYEIDVETGVNGYRVNMYKMGDLNSLPTMKKCTLTVVMTGDFLPVTVKHTDEYSVNYGITLTCKSAITETFEKINDDSVVIPEIDFFTEKSA